MNIQANPDGSRDLYHMGFCARYFPGRFLPSEMIQLQNVMVDIAEWEKIFYHVSPPQISFEKNGWFRIVDLGFKVATPVRYRYGSIDKPLVVKTIIEAIRTPYIDNSYDLYKYKKMYPALNDNEVADIFY